MIAVRTFRNDTDRWLLGQPDTLTLAGLTSDPKVPVGQRNALRTMRYETAPATGLLRKIIVEPGAGGDLELTTEITYDAGGLPIVERTHDAFGRERRVDTRWDDLDGTFPSQVTDALGNVTRMVHHSGLGVVALVEDPNGVVHRRRYDAFGALRRIPSPECTRTACDPLPETIFEVARGAIADEAFRATVLRAGSPSQTAAYDRLGRTLRVMSPGFNGGAKRTTITYDAVFPDRAERIDRFRNFVPPGFEEGVSTHVTYDLLGRPIEIDESFERLTRIRYDGLRAIVTDPVGAVSWSEVDELGRTLRNVTRMGAPIPLPGGALPNQIVTEHVYGPFGELVRQFDPKGNVSSFTYDRLGRRVTHADGDSGVTRTRWDAFGDLVSSVDALGRETLRAVDAAGRTVAESSPEGTSCFQWDAAGASGQLAAQTQIQRDPDGTVTKTTQWTDFDGLGRPRRMHQEVGDGPDLTIDVAYDAFGRVAGATYPSFGSSTIAVKYAYNERGYLSSVSFADDRLIWQANKENLLGQLEKETFGNGVITDRLYDKVSAFPRSVRTQGPSGSLLQDLRYTWWNDGNLRSRTDASDGTSRTEQFEYDPVKRLERWSGTWGSVQYAWDAASNLVAKTTTKTAGPATTATYTPGTGASAGAFVPVHAIASGPEGDYAYDVTGDQTKAPGRTVDWTSFHLPLHVTTDAGNASFAYDAAQQRVRKTDDTRGEITTYVGGLYERRVTARGGTHVYTIAAGSRTVAQVFVETTTDGRPTSPQRIVYLHGDHLGSPHTTTDATGALIERATFDPFGLRVNAADPTSPASSAGPLRIGFTGHEDESSLGLVNMGGRIYDPKVARFLSADPVITAADSPGLNRYVYVRGNPLNYVDPTGFFADTPSSGLGEAVGWIGTLVGLGLPTIGCECASGPPAPPDAHMPPPKQPTEIPIKTIPYGDVSTARVPEVPTAADPGRFMGTVGIGIGMGYRLAGIPLIPTPPSLELQRLPTAEERISRAGSPKSRLVGGTTNTPEQPFLDRHYNAWWNPDRILTAHGNAIAGTVATGAVAVGTAGMGVGIAGMMGGGAWAAAAGVGGLGLGGIGFGAGAATGAAGSAGGQMAAAGGAAALIPQIAQGAGFRTFDAFKRVVGAAGPDMQWHHVVEQTAANVARFGGQMIHNTGNLIRLDVGLHRMVSAYYSSIQPQLTNSTTLTVRQWLSTQSFEAQQKFGFEFLRSLGLNI